MCAREGEPFFSLFCGSRDHGSHEFHWHTKTFAGLTRGRLKERKDKKGKDLLEKRRLLPEFFLVKVAATKKRERGRGKGCLQER